MKQFIRPLSACCLGIKIDCRSANASRQFSNKTPETVEKAQAQIVEFIHFCLAVTLTL
jgi:hypothetical protein